MHKISVGLCDKSYELKTRKRETLEIKDFLNKNVRLKDGLGVDKFTAGEGELIR